jgi:multicomponent Na+:H+ antiporter subunit G
VTIIGLALCVVGAVVILIAAIGLVRFPDALTRQHAATKAGTLGVSLVAIGVAVAVAEPAWTWRVLAIVLLVLITLPLASHAFARAAARGATWDAGVRLRAGVWSPERGTNPGHGAPSREDDVVMDLVSVRQQPEE